MRLYLSPHFVPELAKLPAPERLRICRVCFRRAWRHLQVWLVALLALSCAFAGSFAALPFESSLAHVVIGLTFMLVGYLSFVHTVFLVSLSYIRHEISDT